MARLSTESLSALAALLAAIFAGSSWWEARETRVTVHQDALDQLHQTQRAYIGVQVGRNADSWWTAEFRAVGGSPALNVTTQLQIASIDDDEPVEAALKAGAEKLKAHPEYKGFGYVQGALFLPGSSDIVPLEKAEPLNYKPHKINIYFGEVTYMDIFKQNHTTHYCIRLGRFCEAGNDAD